MLQNLEDRENAWQMDASLKLAPLLERNSMDELNFSVVKRKNRFSSLLENRCTDISLLHQILKFMNANYLIQNKSSKASSMD
jgi:hypothetical protein